MNKFCTLALAILLASACQRDKLDFDMVDDLGFNPEFQLPVVKARLSLADIVLQDSTLTVDPNDGALSLVIDQDSLFDFALADFIEIPNQAPTTITLEEQNFPFLSLNIGLGTLGGVQLSSAEFNQGQLVYSIDVDNPIANDVDVRLRLANASIGGNTFEQVVTLPANTLSITDSIDIAGLVFDFSNGGTTFNYLEVYFGLDDTAQTMDGQNINVGLGLNQLEIDMAEGYFGNRVVNIPSGQFEFDLNGLEEFTSGFRLTNPSIKLISTSTVGMNIELAPKFNGINTDKNVQALGFQPQILQGATTPGTAVTGEIVVDKNNSDIVDFLANVPNQILYSGKATLNPNNTAPTNFIRSDSRLKMGLLIDIPLEFSAENMKLEQVIENVELVSAEESDMVEEVTLLFRNKNGFPFDLDLSISMLDKVTGDSINGIVVPLLEPAPTDGQGRVTQPLVREFAVTFEKDQIASLARIDKIKITAKLNTPNGGQDAIKLYSTYFLETKISVRTQLNINL